MDREVKTASSCTSRSNNVLAEGTDPSPVASTAGGVVYDSPSTHDLMPVEATKMVPFKQIAD